MDYCFARTLSQHHAAQPPMPQKHQVHQFAGQTLAVLFPHFARDPFCSESDFRKKLHQLYVSLEGLLAVMAGQFPIDTPAVAGHFCDSLPALYALLGKDAAAMAREDPAATDADEVILTYPGFYAIAIYRLAHCLYQMQVPLIPRLLTEYAHQQTGIDIHPGAQIGEGFCIDHGTGIVIGQTAVIGNHVKLYQGVTLGAISVEKSLANVKRHPTIEDHVVIYAGANILGGKVRVGHHSIIGGCVWLTESVDAYSKVYHRSQITVNNKQRREERQLEYCI
jgi:serine O-acetyltransferase